jgi:hypothetical protein
MTGILERHGNRIPLNRDAQQRRDRPQASLSLLWRPFGSPAADHSSRRSAVGAPASPGREPGMTPALHLSLAATGGAMRLGPSVLFRYRVRDPQNLAASTSVRFEKDGRRVD